MKKTRKKRRRLKKSVRRGCLSFILLFVAAIVLFVFRSERKHQLERTKVELLHQRDSVDDALENDLCDLLEHPERVDTSNMSISVYDLDHRCIVFRHRSDSLMPPASCMKILTAISAFHHLGTMHQYESKVLQKGVISDSILTGYLIISMDDDPLIDSFDQFAKSIRKKGIRRVRGDIYLDLARRDTLRPHPTASRWDIQYHQLPLLLKGEPFIKNQLFSTLGLYGISVEKNVLFSHPWLSDASALKNPVERCVATNSAKVGTVVIDTLVHSLCDIIAPMLVFSNNILAESVLHHTTHYVDRWGGGYEEETHSVQQFLHRELPELEKEGIVVNDGSGLSPLNRLTTDFFVRLLSYAFDRKELRDVLIEQVLASPNGGWRTGTMSGRLTEERYTGRLFCKTGTLTTIGCSSLTGYCLGENGRWYAFSILQKGTPVYEARIFQDRFCRILAAH